jgi:hypothetical protein
MHADIKFDACAAHSKLTEQVVAASFANRRQNPIRTARPNPMTSTMERIARDETEEMQDVRQLSLSRYKKMRWFRDADFNTRMAYGYEWSWYVPSFSVNYIQLSYLLIKIVIMTQLYLKGHSPLTTFLLSDREGVSPRYITFSFDGIKGDISLLLYVLF